MNNSGRIKRLKINGFTRKSECDCACETQEHNVHQTLHSIYLKILKKFKFNRNFKDIGNGERMQGKNQNLQCDFLIWYACFV